ncbi:MAG TPA: HD-GYP domain-containing protein [Moorella mulderi]|nr:HD-GYP domain-containing protein [Moorella mulderi]
MLPGFSQGEARAYVAGLIPQLESHTNALLEEVKGVAPVHPITLVAGVATYPQDAQEESALIRAPENDLFRAKHSRDNRYIYFSIISEIGSLKTKELFPALQVLLALINVKDRYTYGHSERVMMYSLALTEELGLPPSQQDTLRLGAFLHDLGKIEMPDSVLNKSGPLTREEWEIMKMHPLPGSRLVGPLPFFQDILPIIKHHHENWDGTGYPEGLKGEETPFLARIVSLADSFDALTTDRPYRRALSIWEACRELKRHVGSHYDPCLVDPFIKAVKRVYETRKAVF